MSKMSKHLPPDSTHIPDMYWDKENIDEVSPSFKCNDKITIRVYRAYKGSSLTFEIYKKTRGEYRSIMLASNINSVEVYYGYIYVSFVGKPKVYSMDIQYDLL
jgi:hypothetical protein